MTKPSKNKEKWTTVYCIFSPLGAQTRAIERLCGGGLTRNPDVSDFYLAYARDCARFHAFQGLSRCSKGGGWDALGQQTLVGAYHSDLGKPGKVHKNHAYNFVRSRAELVIVERALGAALVENTVDRAEASVMFDSPEVYTVEGRLVIRQARHRLSDIYWLYTAVSGETSSSNVRVVVDDVQCTAVPATCLRRRGGHGLQGSY